MKELKKKKIIIDFSLIPIEKLIKLSKANKGRRKNAIIYIK